MEIDTLKRLAGERAASYVQDGMALGLGSGTTVRFFLHALAERVRQGLKVRCIPTSTATAALARELGIPLDDFNTLTELDLTVDGADEVDPECNLIKGGGGALLREKVVAAASRRVYIIVDETKLKPHLGGFPLPVEVVPFGWEATRRKLEALGCRAELRLHDEEPFITENGNYILDCHFERIDDPAKLEQEITLIPGVVESGLFVGMADKVIIGRAPGVVEERDCPRRLN